ncbi:MAG: prolyl oligopeptidase family serine peptidase [Phycisphaerae bacterium]|nr:prolyl oligopeptidase family serine peptidase [Phycisphaerae bacterium]
MTARNTVITLVVLTLFAPIVVPAESKTPAEPAMDADGFVTEWLILGPLPNYLPDDKTDYEHHKKLCWGYEHDFLSDVGGESGVKPVAGGKVTFRDKTVEWKKHTSETFLIDFNKIFPPDGNNVAYAWCTLDAPEASKGLLTFGSDDGIKVWLNGKLVHSMHLGRGIVQDEDLAFVDFRKGANTILVKVDNDWGGFGFCMRFLLKKDAAMGELCRGRLMLKQDKYFVADAKGEISVRPIAKGIPADMYSATVTAKITDPAGKVTILKGKKKLGDEILLKPQADLKGVYKLTVSLQDEYGKTKELKTGFAFTPELAGKEDNLDSLTALMDPKKHPKLYAKVLPYLEIRILGLKYLLENAESSADAEAIGLMLQDLFEIISEYNAGKDCFAGKPGVFVKAYRANIDNSLQPYSVDVPQSYVPSKPSPLTVFLHGYGGPTLTRGKWVAGQSRSRDARENPHTIIELNVYGRGNTGYHAQGTKDVFRAMEEVTRDYNIDPKRIYLKGGSMGGHGTWFVSIYHPDRFAAISPVCGYCHCAEDDWWDKTDPKEFKELMMHYGLTFFAENYLHVPQFIHHGNEDKSVDVKNSRAMKKRLEELGYEYIYKEYGGVGHSVPVDGKAVDEWFMKYTLNPYPKKVIYKTVSLRHNGAYWVRIDEFIDPNSVTKIEAEVTGPNEVKVRTRNVRQFSLDLPEKLFDRTKPVNVQVDEMPAVAFAADSSNPISLRKSATGPAWQDFTGKTPPGLRKKHGLCGAMPDVYEEKFIYVYGTAGDDDEDEINRRVATETRDAVTGANWGQIVGDFVVKKDADVTKEDIQTANLILFGRPESNAMTAKIQPKLPIRLEGDKLIASRNHPAKDLYVAFIYPNPLNPERYVFVQYAADAEKFKPLHVFDQDSDYMVFKRTDDKKGKGHEKDLQFIEAGHFNGRWRFDRDSE